MILSKKNLINHIAEKTKQHIKVWDCLPDIAVMTEEQYSLLKDSSYISTLRIVIEKNIHSPILLKK